MSGREFVVTMDPFLDMGTIDGGTAANTDALTAAALDDAAYHLGDAPDGTTATVNTDNAADPHLWFLTLHYPDGTHQTDTYHWADESAPTGDTRA